MEDEGWTFGEKHDILGLRIPPVSPLDAKRDLKEGHPGSTQSGRRRKKQIADERADMKRDYEERLAAENALVAARKGKPKCQPCKNRSRGCDLERPVCGNCKELNIAAKCIYRSAVDQDNVAPTSPNPPPPSSTPRTPGNPTSPDISMVDAPVLVGSPERATSHQTKLRQTTLFAHDQDDVKGYSEGSQRKKRERKRGRELADTEGNDHNDARYDIKRRRLGGPGS